MKQPYKTVLVTLSDIPKVYSVHYTDYRSDPYISQIMHTKYGQIP